MERGISKRRRLKQHEEPSDAVEDDQVRELLRKHFERSFAPLPIVHSTGHKRIEQPRDEAAVREDDFEGFTSDDEDHVTTIVFDDATNPQDGVQGSKKFMGSAPPRYGAATAATTVSKRKDLEPCSDEEDEQTEQANLKNDIELQRLIKESHLLDPAKQSDKNQRKKIVDSRMNSMGSRSTFFDQASMPMSHRKGMIAKKDRIESKRRHDARENGIILEKAAHKKTAPLRRDRSVDMPGIGKFRNGSLNLSKRDVASMTSTRNRNFGRASSVKPRREGK